MHLQVDDYAKIRAAIRQIGRPHDARFGRAVHAVGAPRNGSAGPARRRRVHRAACRAARSPKPIRSPSGCRRRRPTASFRCKTTRSQLRVTHGIAELRPNETAAILMARAKADVEAEDAQKHADQRLAGAGCSAWRRGTMASRRTSTLRGFDRRPERCRVPGPPPRFQFSLRWLLDRGDDRGGRCWDSVVLDRTGHRWLLLVDCLRGLLPDRGRGRLRSMAAATFGRLRLGPSLRSIPVLRRRNRVDATSRIWCWARSRSWLTMGLCGVRCRGDAPLARSARADGRQIAGSVACPN